MGVTFGSAGRTYIVDWNNHRIRQVTAEATLQTVIGTDFIGDGPADHLDLTLPGALGTMVDLNHPTQMTELQDGTYLLVSWHNHKLRKFFPDTGRVWVTCGRGAGFAGDDGPAAGALLNQPSQVVQAADGSLFILDQRNQVVRRIAADQSIHTVAGTPGQDGYAGDGGSPLNAMLSFPKGSNPPTGGGLALDAMGRLYISDTLNHRVRRVDFAQDLIETVVGTGVAGYSGDGGLGTAAQINNPRKLALGPDGRIYIADEYNHRVRVFDPATGMVDTVAGNGTGTFGGDGEDARQASLNRPAGVSFDGQGRLYIADAYNHRIRVMTLP